MPDLALLMAAEALLPRLGVELSDLRRIEPMPGGLSGARLYRLWLRARDERGGATVLRSLVLKYEEPLEGWLGEISGDAMIREAQLVASGLFADLPRDIVTPTRAVAFRGSRSRPRGAALLMRDIRPYLVREPLRTPPGAIPACAVAVVDRLAQMHARLWNDPRLDDPCLGLMSPEHALLVTGPRGVEARLAAGDTLPYLALASESWRDFFALVGDVVARRFQAMIDHPEQIARVIERLPRTLVHGDVWGPNLGWMPGELGRSRPRMLLLDWALSLAGPCTYDPLWFSSMWMTADPTHIMALYRARLTRSLRARGVALDGAAWLALADAGYLRTVLTCGEGMARAALSAPAGAPRHVALAWLRWWMGRALQAADRLGR
jgi:hypothetical protein